MGKFYTCTHLFDEKSLPSTTQKFFGMQLGLKDVSDTSENVYKLHWI